MSRLIDADAIRLRDDLPYKASVKRVIDQSPTADAIPVSWLRRWVSRNVDYSKPNTILMGSGIYTAIADWRKEQENAKG